MTPTTTPAKAPALNFEIGNKRPDGRYNIWSLRHVRPGPADWVIVTVVPDWQAGMVYIEQQMHKKAKVAKTATRPAQEFVT